MQAFGKYGDAGTASTLKMRDYKDATDLVVDPVCATGTITHCLTASQKGATEDGTGRGTPIVIDRAAFNQGENAQYTPHIEQTDTMDTLVSKGPHAVGVPLMFKVRGGSPTETGEQGGTPGRVAGKGFLGSEDKTFTITAVQDQWLAQPVISPTITTCKGSRGGSSSEAIDELIAIHDAQQPIPLDSMNLLSRLGPGGENHSLQNFVPGDPMFTLTKAQHHGVAQPIPFRKSKRAQSTTDNETWVEADAANTLNLFDLGDTRTTPAVVEPFAFTQNQRDEVRILGDTAAALSLPGTHQTNYIAEPRLYENHPNDSRVTGPHDIAPTVVSRFGTGGGNVPLVNNEPHIVQASELRLSGKITEQQVCPTLTAGAKQGDTEPLAVAPISFQPGNLVRKAGADPSTDSFPTLTKDSGDQSPHVCAPTLTASNDPSRSPQSSEVTQQINAVHQVTMAVRRLTPEECEALQGFEKGHTRIPWKGKAAEDAPDGPRYKACGNSMATPVIRWIGLRIQMFEEGKLD
jgi:DNA (cytosine-5)-methyltransferase 1